MAKRNMKQRLEEYIIESRSGRPLIRFSLAVFLVTLLLTFLVWDYYVNSRDYLDSAFTSVMILVSGIVFSCAAGFLALTLEVRGDYLQKEVNQLRGFLPICASCKKIRDDKGYWERIETYLERHGRTQLTHGLCQECIERLYPEHGSRDDSESIKGGT